MAISVVPIAHKQVINGRVSLIAGTLTAVRVGSTNMGERKWLFIQNASKVPMYIGSSMTEGSATAITAAELAKEGIKIRSGGEIWLPVSDTITIYARLHNTATIKSGFLRVMELA